MNLIVDSLSSTTGWSASSAKATAFGVNQLSDFIAGLNSTSLILKFATNANNEYIQKTVNVDLTNYEKLTFHIWSRNKKSSGQDYMNSSEFAYKIEFGTSDIYYIPTYQTFTDITIDISSLTTITKIKITCLHDTEDYLIISNMVASKDELPRDIFQGIKEQFEYSVNKFYPHIANGILNKGVLIDTISGLTNDTSILFSNPLLYIEKYAVIRIDDGTNSETHQIDHNDELQFYFNSMYSGTKLLHNYTNANVYLTFPCEYGVAEKEIILPGVSLWGMNPEEMPMTTKIEGERDTFKTTETVQEGFAPVNFLYTISIDCEARHNSLIAIMSQIVRNIISQEYIWVNGKKINLKRNGVSTFIEPNEGFNEIPKIQYLVDIFIREDVFEKTSAVKTITNIRTFTVETN